MSILEKIVDKKRQRVEEQKRILALEEIREKVRALPHRGDFLFFSRIKRTASEPIKIIAEIKKASPLKGLLKEYNIEQMADVYVSAGADAISVITEEDFFSGKPEYLTKIKAKHHGIPVLRKDFIFDEYQIYESKLLGADAILLIADILSDDECSFLYQLAKSLMMDVLFEIHDEEGLKKAIHAGVDIIGINNRDLKTLQIDLSTTFKLRELIPKNKVVVSESGISSVEEVRKLLKIGVDAILVGTSIVLSDKPEEQIRKLKYF